MAIDHTTEKVARMAHDEALIEAAEYRCQCDGAAGREACKLSHASAPARRCGRTAGLTVRREPDGTEAVVCDKCLNSRINELRKPRGRRTAEPVGDQLDLFSVIEDPEA